MVKRKKTIGIIHKKTIALIKKWLSEDPLYDQETWPELKKALDEGRKRKLFENP